MKFSSSKQLVQIFLALCLAMLSVVSRAEVESLTFIHSDHLGSPIIATDQQGEVLWRKDYQPFGSSTSSAHSDNSVGFTGHIEDDSLGLTYMQGRWYHPELGRFTGIDPVGFVDGNVSSFNRYAYANNNPYRYTDPDGKIPVDTLFDAANVVYDLGKAGFGAATGNSALVAEGLADAAADAVAMAIPYVPAGSSKVARMAAEAAEEVSDRNVAKEGNYVYRGLAKGDNPAEGLSARAPGAGNSEISHVAGKRNSQWISTTKDPNIAIEKYGENGAVRIDLNKIDSPISDVSGGFSNGGRMSNWAKRDQEVLIQNSIPAHAMERIK